MEKDFTIIFDKIDKIACPDASINDVGAVVLSNAFLTELDELAELRRVVAEITEPDVMSFTTT